jgi:hypothetical protein
VRERANELTGLLSEDRTRVVFVALPEELVVTETLETLVRFREGGLLGGPPLLYLNRGTAPTLTEDEDALITGLSGLSLPQEAATLVRAGRWERELELGTQMALERLTEGFGSAPEVVGVRPAGGTQRQVVEHVAVVLGRPVGLTRRVLSWC